MITWGIVSGAMAFATGPASFLTLRFLLGALSGFDPAAPAAPGDFSPVDTWVLED